MSKTFRDATLALAKHHAFARKLVNSGRLSVPSYLTQSSLNTPDLDDFEGDQVPGAPLCDAPVVGKGEVAWLLDYFGYGFQLLVFTDDAELPVALNAPLLTMAGWPVPVQLVQVCAAPVPAASEHAQAVLFDAQGLVAQRYDATTGTCYLIRPDQHVVARWRHFDEGLVQAALARATAQSLKENV
jgi:3-(3-hydroxy-phenyl)propionate hydroxylase